MTNGLEWVMTELKVSLKLLMKALVAFLICMFVLVKQMT